MKKLSVSLSTTEWILGIVYIFFQLLALPILLGVANILFHLELNEVELNFVCFAINFICVTVIFHKYLIRSAKIAFFQPLNTPVPQNAKELWKNIKNFDYIVTSSSGHNPDIQKSILPEFLKVASMLNTLREEGKIQQVFSDSRAEYLIFRCGETATGTEL